MSGTKQVLFLAGLSLVLCDPVGSPVGAAEPYAGAASSDGTTSLPAVDGLNAKVSGFGGANDGRDLYGVGGSVAVPLGFRYGLQIDALVGGADNRTHGDLSAFGTTAHLFWRDPARGLFGAYGRYLHFDAAGGVNSYVGAGEGALYLDRITLDAIVGAESGDNIDTQFYDVARLGYYPTDNLLLSVGQSHILGVNTGLAGAEWGFGVGGGTMASLFANGGVTENGVGTVLGGLRVYFGQSDKTLIQRHREDDPVAVNPMEITSVGEVSQN